MFYISRADTINAHNIFEQVKVGVLYKSLVVSDCVTDTLILNLSQQLIK